MKIFIVCSKKFYGKIPDIQKTLEENCHVITLPNFFDDPGAEAKVRAQGNEEHSKWKAELLNHSADVIDNNDAVLVLNFDKDKMKNYIGGATFLEMYDAFRLGKKIYMYNDAPEGILHDEIIGFDPIIINGDLTKVV
ncbi:MAG: hypothetical protein Q7S53_02225 [bacterium]|nr:hypothetical protein [bacterium]